MAQICRRQTAAKGNFAQKGMVIIMEKPKLSFATYLKRPPRARAAMEGNGVRGTVEFYQTPYGVLVLAEIYGLPKGSPDQSPVFGFHIHEGKYSAPPHTPSHGGHYNPYHTPHPYHAGDLPPLFGADGCAFALTLTSRFTVEEVMGRTCVIHAGADDFTTQPSGNAGKILAAGEIVK